MLRVYAVDPTLAAAKNPSFLALSNLFGADRGRVISRFPGSWVKQAIKAVKEAEELGEREKLKLYQVIETAKQDKMVKSRRNFDPTLSHWLSNCLAEDLENPWDAIIVNEDDVDEAKVISAKEALDENHRLMFVETGLPVKQTGAEIAATLQIYFEVCKNLYLIDKYFRLLEPKYQETLKACLAQIPVERREEIRLQIHSCEANAAAQRNFRPDIVGEIIPKGISIEWFHWGEKKDGVQFHDRYLLTEVGGVVMGAGFSAEGPNKEVNVELVSKRIYEETLKKISEGAIAYELLDTFRILSDGSIEEFKGGRA